MILGTAFDTAPLGREMTLNLVKHVAAGYTLQEPPIVRLLDRAVLHFVPFTESLNQIIGQYQNDHQVCDPIIAEEFADRLFSPESYKKRDLFIQMLTNGGFDLALTFSAGGFDLQYPHGVDSSAIFDHMADNIREQRLREVHKRCNLETHHIHQTNMVEKLINFFMKQYQVPLFSIQLNCCKMPPEDQIAQVWRRNIHKLINFLILTETGVEGFIHNHENLPMRDATVTIKGSSLKKPVTKNLAYFRFVLPEGEYELEIQKANSPAIHTVPFSLNGKTILNLGEIVVKNEESEMLKLNNGKNETKVFSNQKIIGLILDEGSHPIKGAKIKLIESDIIMVNRSDDMGHFVLNNVPLGPIVLEVTAYGHVSGQK